MKKTLVIANMLFASVSTFGASAMDLSSNEQSNNESVRMVDLSLNAQSNNELPTLTIVDNNGVPFHKWHEQRVKSSFLNKVKSKFVDLVSFVGRALKKMIWFK